ncbi:DNA-binding protein [Streptomyces sp. LRa12]|uniref:DNA-binding protein n=1 Tax=Streptomyces sp. LRa12 TaxID=2563107 RepID=UPI00109ED2EF|nr:DNA-binding protein [Streptomyces sp. LRa12]THA90022.1 DNA-binding protein [Streptomyces sp. LRa12]
MTNAGSGGQGPKSERGYLLIKADLVKDDAWMSQPEAAHYLGIALLRVGMLIANAHLTPAEDPAGRAGVTTVSVEAEKTWRADASIRAKAIRLLKDTTNWF